jgi:hypothetical protein
MINLASIGSAPSVGRVTSADSRLVFLAVAKAWQQLNKAFFDTYRPELHYMRGPGPRWREKHARRKRLDSTQAPKALQRAIR